ncbi:hypothetical protein, partial [Burkholderia latens]|uniref:hypothetical protein n=1 Tax=Burkholderia latens TaxID=488446 RepID=UPI001ABB6E6C
MHRFIQVATNCLDMLMQDAQRWNASEQGHRPIRADLRRACVTGRRPAAFGQKRSWTNNGNKTSGRQVEFRQRTRTLSWRSIL